MMVLVTYDVNTETEAGKKRLRKMAKHCLNFGQRVQNSVFECIIDPGQLRQLQEGVHKIINTETDSVRFYYLGDEYRNRVEHVGAKKPLDIEGDLII
jgi:CRISPR-associated protein Cas2